MKKRAQLTIFVIIAIVIVGLILGYFLLINKSKSEVQTIPPEIQPVYDYVSSCIIQSGNFAINKIGFYGGYNSFDDEILNANFTVAYWVFDNRSYIPSSELVNSELSKAFLEAFPICIDDFKDLTGFKISASAFSVKSQFTDEQTGFKLIYPLKIIKEDNTFTLEKFEQKINSKFGLMYGAAKQIAETSINGDLGYCITCADAILNSSRLYGSIFDYDDSSILVITPENSEVNNVTLQFDIALRY